MNDTVVPNPPDVTAPIRDQLNDLAALLSLWWQRDEQRPVARAGANNALGVIDTLLRQLHDLRDWLVDGIREDDDAAAAQTDALLERVRGEHGDWRDQASGPGAPGAQP